MFLNRHLVFFVLTLAVFKGMLSANEIIARTNDITIKVESDAARQLRIIKTALINGPSEQNRVDAAVELLIQPDFEYRKVLIEILAMQSNPPARKAVCKALSHARMPISNKSDFLEPLMAILQEKDSLDAKSAAEATLIFEYKTIAPKITEIINNTENDRSIRLNGIYALSLRPTDKEAVSELVNLFDDSDKTVADAAQKALPFWIPQRLNQSQILEYLSSKSQREIIRDWTEYQGKELRRLESERDQWKAIYFTSLENDYETADNTVKGIIIQNALSSNMADIKLWGLEKVAVMPPSINLPAEFNNSLLRLISDPSRKVRLRTAEVLSTMSDRNPAERLLAQYNIEAFDDVKLRQFKALGEACYFAFSPGSSIKLPESVRTETLSIAETALDQPSPEKVLAGAEVIRKLLEPSSISKDVVEKYLNLILARYSRALDKNPQLAVGILEEMTKMCVQSSHRDLLAEKFLPYFKKATIKENDQSLRRIAISGLIHIDKRSALEMFVNQKLTDDPDESVRLKVIELAGETGNKDDIKWLIDKLPSNGEGTAAWKSIVQILSRQKAADIYAFAQKIETKEISSKRFVQLLELAKKNAELEKDTSILNAVQKILRPIQLDILLDKSDTKETASLIAEILKEGDINPKDSVAEKFTKYFESKASLSQKNEMFNELKKITEGTNAINTPQWQKLLENWSEKLGAVSQNNSKSLQAVKGNTR